MSHASTALKFAHSFTYHEYTQIIAAYRPILRDFHDVNGATSDPGEFCLLRHDIECSLPRALAMAEIDADLGIKATFCVQVKNAAYNALATRNAKAIRKLIGRFHFVGLHLYISDIVDNNVGELIRQLRFQRLVLEEALGQKISRFSCHRPRSWVLKLNLRNETDMLNTYDPRLFELTNGIDEPSRIKYMSDSNHSWKYGHPLAFRNKYRKFQILMHPDEWSENGCATTTREHFRELIDLNRKEFMRTLQDEYNNFEM